MIDYDILTFVKLQSYLMAFELSILATHTNKTALKPTWP